VVAVKKVKVGLELESTMHNLEGAISHNGESKNEMFISRFLDLEKKIRKETGKYLLNHDTEAGYRQVEVRSIEKSDAEDAARGMLRGIIALSRYLKNEGMVMPINETVMCDYEEGENCTAHHIMRAADAGSKRARMLVPFLTNFFRNMNDGAKGMFGISADDDLGYLECIRNSTTFNSGLHTNLDLSEIEVNREPLLRKIEGTNGSHRYGASDFKYMLMLEKLLYTLSPLFIRHTSISPYAPVCAFAPEIREKIRNEYGDVAAIDTGGVSARIMLMYSINPLVGPDREYELHGHASYLKYWNVARSNGFTCECAISSLDGYTSPFHSYGSLMGLSRYMLDAFNLVGVPEMLGQNPEIAMHWLPVAHPYAYPKSISNGSGARQALEYKIMGGSVEGVFASAVLAGIFGAALDVNLREESQIYPTYDRRTRTLVLPHSQPLMKVIKHAIAERNSVLVDEYNLRLLGALRRMLGERESWLLGRVMDRVPSGRVLEYAEYRPVLTKEEAEKCVIRTAKENLEIAKEDLEILSM